MTIGRKYMACVYENVHTKNRHTTGYVYGDSLKEVRKAIFQKAKNVKWHRKTYVGLHPQHIGGIWKMGWRPINITDKEWAPVKHVATLVYDTGMDKLVQGDNPQPSQITKKWRIVRSDGSLSDYVEFSMNLI